MQQAPPPIPDTASSPGASGPTWAVRLWMRLRPALRQTWLNLKVWVPFLQNPADRARLATFLARERRTGLEWEVVLPAQCWSCGTGEALRDRQFERPVRSFEFPLPIVGLGGACTGLFLLFTWFHPSWTTLILALISGGITVGALLVKSWKETVRITMSTCPEHARQMWFPECVVDQGELYLFLPSAKLTQATIVAAKAERLKQQGYKPMASDALAAQPGSSADDDDGEESDRPRYRPPPPPKPKHLPPIKLEGDE